MVNEFESTVKSRGETAHRSLTDRTPGWLAQTPNQVRIYPHPTGISVDITWIRGIPIREAVLKGAKESWSIVVDVGKRSDGRRKKQRITVK